MVTDDQTLMMAMPASRKFVMADDGKMYKGFTLPPDMSADQEERYKAAIDEREAGAMQRQAERGRSDRLETAEDLAEIVAASPVGQIPAAGADAFVMGRDIERGDYGSAAIAATSVLIPYVSASALKRITEGGTEAAQSAMNRLEDLQSRLQAGSIDEAEAKRIGSAIEQEFKVADRSSGRKSFNQIAEEESLYDIVGRDQNVSSLEPAFTADQRTRLLQRFDDLKEADKQLFELRREQGFPRRTEDSYEQRLAAQLGEERDQIRELLNLGSRRTRSSFSEREALRKNLLDRKIERARLRSRKQEADYKRVFGEDPPRGLRGPSDEEYARMGDNFFSSVTQRRPTAAQMDELEAESRRLGLSSVDELLDLQDDFLKQMPYTYQEKKALTADQLDELESQARRLGLSGSDEYLELLGD